MRITGLAAAAIGHVAFTERIELHELTAEHRDLEQIFFALTDDDGHRPALHEVS